MRTRSRWFYSFFAAFLILTLAAQCNPIKPPTAQTPMPTAKPTNAELAGLLGSAAAAPPRVTGTNPAGGQELPLSGTLEISFDQSMEPESTAAALSVSDAEGKKVQGKVAWSGPRKLVFTAASPLKTGASYRAELAATAKSAEGQALAEPVNLSFQAVGQLAVAQTFPAKNANDINSQSTITVVFNRPVVPLRIAEEQDKLPNPLALQPAVEGKGEWLNTSTYIFHPAGYLKGGTTYTATVPAGLQDVSGGEGSTLAEDYTWTFTTQPPDVAFFQIGDYINPELGIVNIPLVPEIVIGFTQPMDKGATEAAMSIAPANKGGENGPAAPLTTEWNDEGTEVKVKSAQRLALETAYNLRVTADARALDGGALAKPLDTIFTTVRYPAVESIQPANGDDYAEMYAQVRFTAPMKLETIQSRIVFDPPLKDMANNSWYNPYDNTMSYYGLEPSTSYTLTVQAGAEDLYGNKTTDDAVSRFTTQPLSPSVQVFSMWDPMFRAGTPTTIYLGGTNVSTATLTLYRMERAEYFDYARGQKGWDVVPSENWIIQQETVNLSGGLNERVIKPVELSDGGEPLIPGYYLFTLDSPDVQHSGARFLDRRLMTVVTHTLTLKNSPREVLAWVTDATTARPAAGVPVSLYDGNLTRIASATTGDDGLALFEVEPSTDTTIDPSARWVMVEGEGRFGIAFSYWGAGVSPYNFGIDQDYYYGGMQDHVVYAYTDRPIYRPGQPVHFKGIVRRNDDLSYSLPAMDKVDVVISSFQGEVSKQTVTLNAHGSFSGQFDLPDDAALGSYTIQVVNTGADPNSPAYYIGSVNFQVAEYRRPEFQLDVTTDPANVLPGDAFTGTLDASYYSGGAVAGAEVTWTLTASPFTFTPPDKFKPFSFTDEVWDSWDWFRWREDAASQQIAQGKGTTGDDGRFTADLTADLGKETTSQTLTFEATLTDFAGTVVSGRAATVAHQAAVYPGIRAASYVAQEGKPASLEAAALDWEGNPLANQALKVTVVERKWNSVQKQDESGRITWESAVEEIPVESFDLTTGADGRVSFDFTPPKGGVYRARVTAADGRGNTGAASTFVWAAGKDFIPWQQSNDRSMRLVTDKDTYTPGETAQVLIASPFEGESYALVTVERGRVRYRHVVALAGSSTVYELPIEADFAPNAYISVLVVKGADDTNPRPDFRLGLVKINVTTEAQTLKVALATDLPTASPGDRVTYTVTTTGLDGAPAPSEVSLALADLSTLSLADPNALPVLDFFYSPRNLGVSTSISLVQSNEDYNAEIADMAALPEGRGTGSGGGKGSGYLGVTEIRENFPDTAFWAGELETDANGTASVTITLPDNLTTWRMDARAVTDDTRAGQSTLDLVSSKPLLVRPQAPRFFTQGDKATLGAAVHNNTNQELTVTASLEAGGVQMSNEPAQTVTIAAGRQALVTWSVTVPTGIDRADLLFTATGTGADGATYDDATRPTLASLDGGGIPVYKYEAFETVGTSGVLTAAGGRIESISLPEGMDVTQGDLTVKMQPSLAASITDGLRFLEHFEYECVEQTVSRFLPNVVTTRVMKAAGVADPALEAGLREQVNAALQKLYNWQKSDGGWGWWPTESKSDLNVTTWVLYGLVEAQSAGYEVRQSVIDDAVRFVAGHMKVYTRLAPPDELNRQAFGLYVLARAGKPDVANSSLLYEQRGSLNLYGRALLLHTLHLIDPGDARKDALVSDLANAAIQSATGTHWEEGEPDWYNWNTDTRTTAIVLGALVAVDPGNAMNANAVRWLMSHREGNGAWKTTQETAWTLLSMARWMEATGELQANYAFAAALNGETKLEGQASRETIRDTSELKIAVADLLKDAPNLLGLAKGEGSGALYYTAHLNMALPVGQIEPLDRGVVIDRQFFRPDDLTTPVTSAAPGDLLLVRLTLVARNTLHYVVVEDPLPAGLEAVDTSLKTSETQTVPTDTEWDKVETEGYGWWYFTHTELRDEKVVLSTNVLPPGTYVYTYLARASTAGEFGVIPPTAREFYFPEVYGRGAGSVFTVAQP